MSRILFLILILFLSSRFVMGQVYDITDLVTEGLSNGSVGYGMFASHVSHPVGDLSRAVHIELVFVQGFNGWAYIPNDGKPVELLSSELCIVPHATSPNMNPNHRYYFEFGGRKFVRFNYNGREYQFDLVTQHTATTRHSGIDWLHYRARYVVFSDDFFESLDAWEGAGIGNGDGPGGLPDLDGSCCESLILLLQWIGELQQESNTLLQNIQVESLSQNVQVELLLREENLLLQYILAILSLLLGMLLAMVFLYGLKLR